MPRAHATGLIGSMRAIFMSGRHPFAGWVFTLTLLAAAQAAAALPVSDWRDVEFVGMEAVTVGPAFNLEASVAVVSVGGSATISADVFQGNGAPTDNFIALRVSLVGSPRTGCHPAC